MLRCFALSGLRGTCIWESANHLSKVVLLIHDCGGDSKKSEVTAMESPVLAPHESMELHEMINFKTICLAKAKLMQGMVFDKDLKALMQKDVEQSIKAVAELKAIYQHAPIH